jgi:hypothetical protein
MKFEQLEETARKYAESEASRQYLMEFRKSKKALLMAEAERENPKLPIAAQERYAYSHPEYLELLDGLRVAIEQAVSLKHQLSIWQMKFETWRTQESTKRAEMNLR